MKPCTPRFAKHWLPLAALLLAACTGSGVNNAQVFVPITGSITLRAQTLTPYAQVTYLVDGQQVATASDPASGYQVRYDVAPLSNGLHLVSALGTLPDGTQQPLFSESILVQN